MIKQCCGTCTWRAAEPAMSGDPDLYSCQCPVADSFVGVTEITLVTLDGGCRCKAHKPAAAPVKTTSATSSAIAAARDAVVAAANDWMKQAEPNDRSAADKLVEAVLHLRDLQRNQRLADLSRLGTKCYRVYIEIVAAQSKLAARDKAADSDADRLLGWEPLLDQMT